MRPIKNKFHYLLICKDDIQNFFESELWIHGASWKGLEELNQELLCVSKYLVPSLRNHKKNKIFKGLLRIVQFVEVF